MAVFCTREKLQAALYIILINVLTAIKQFMRGLINKMEKSTSIIISILATALIISVLSAIFVYNINDKYAGDVCSRVDILSANNYNGTFIGGYSCFVKGDRIDVWFNPIGDSNCLGCDPYNYHFVCYTGRYEYCFLAETFLEVDE